MQTLIIYVDIQNIHLCRERNYEYAGANSNKKKLIIFKRAIEIFFSKKQREQNLLDMRSTIHTINFFTLTIARPIVIITINNTGVYN